MPSKNPHVYATRTPADLQEANPKNPNFKGKKASKSPRKTSGGGPQTKLRSRLGKLAKARTAKSESGNPGNHYRGY